MTSAERRKAENEALLRRMKDGDNLCHTNLSAFRWAPRPTLEKDKKEMARIFGDKREETNG